MTHSKDDAHINQARSKMLMPDKKCAEVARASWWILILASMLMFPNHYRTRELYCLHLSDNNIYTQWCAMQKHVARSPAAILKLEGPSFHTFSFFFLTVECTNITLHLRIRFTYALKIAGAKRRSMWFRTHL